MHWGDPISFGVRGDRMDESAEVSLLTRSIVIQGQPQRDDPSIGEIKEFIFIRKHCLNFPSFFIRWSFYRLPNSAAAENYWN